MVGIFKACHGDGIIIRGRAGGSRQYFLRRWCHQPVAGTFLSAVNFPAIDGQECPSYDLLKRTYQEKILPIIEARSVQCHKGDKIDDFDAVNFADLAFCSVVFGLKTAGSLRRGFSGSDGDVILPLFDLVCHGVLESLKCVIRTGRSGSDTK